MNYFAPLTIIATLAVGSAAHAEDTWRYFTPYNSVVEAFAADGGIGQKGCAPEGFDKTQTTRPDISAQWGISAGDSVWARAKYTHQGGCDFAVVSEAEIAAGEDVEAKLANNFSLTEVFLPE